MKNLKTYEQFINEGRSAYDGIASKLTSNIFQTWIKGWKFKQKRIPFIFEVDDKISFEIEATLYIDKKIEGFSILDSTGADANDYDEEEDEYLTPFIIIDFAINPKWLPGYWQEIYMHLIDVVRHEMEHITQGGRSIGNYREGKPEEDDQLTRALISQGLLPKCTYLMLPKELDANIQGLRNEAKKRREPMIDTINRYLDTQVYLTPEEREHVLDTWRRRAKEIGGIPNF